MKLIFNKEDIQKYGTYGDTVKAFVCRKNEILFFYYIKEDQKFSSIPVTACYNRYSSSHTNLEEAENFLNVINDVIDLIPGDISQTLFFDKFYYNIADRFMWLDYNTEKLKTFILTTLVNKWNSEYTEYLNEFNEVLSKHEADFEAVTYKEENRLYELSRTYGFIISQEFKESKSNKLLSKALKLTNEFLNKLNE